MTKNQKSKFLAQNENCNYQIKYDREIRKDNPKFCTNDNKNEHQIQSENDTYTCMIFNRDTGYLGDNCIVF